MPRKYKRKLGAPLRRQYSEEQLERALEAVVCNRMSFRQAEDQFGVPRNTIFRKYHGKNTDKIGKPPVLNENEELQITKALIAAANFGYPLTEYDLKQFIQHYLNNKGVQTVFKDNLLGNDWVKSFLNRNKDLSVRFSENIKRARADLTADVIQKYFENLKITLEGVPPANIINYDESNLTDDPGKQRVIVRRGSKRASRIIDSSKSSTSIMLSATAAGEMLPPYIVYKAKNVYPEWIQNGPNGAIYNRSPSGWFDAVLFEDWFSKTAFPYLRRKEGVKILIGDNLSSHISLNIIEKCEQNNILFVFLPPNSTHLCQPLDVAVFRPMKIAWRKILTAWKQKHRGTVPKSIFPSLLKQLLIDLKPNASTNIKSGFAASGIVPLDPQRVVNKVLGRPDAQVDDNALTRSFNEILDKKVRREEKRNVTRKKKINIEAGQSVKASDFNNTPHESTDIAIEAEIQEDAEALEVEAISSSDDEEPCVVPDKRQKNIKKVPENCDNVLINSFIVAKFIYNLGTKKQTEKNLLLKF